MNVPVAPVTALADPAPDYAAIFDFAPLAMTLADYSALFLHFASLRAAAITDLQAWLNSDWRRVDACLKLIEFQHANQAALALFGCADFAELIAHRARLESSDVLLDYTSELLDLWSGETVLSRIAVYSRLNGEPMTLRVTGRLLPARRGSMQMIFVLNAASSEEEARRRIALSEAYARALFQKSPVAITLADMRGTKTLFDELRISGVTDFLEYVKAHPEFPSRCLENYRMLDANQQALNLYKAVDKATLFNGLDKTFPPDARHPFITQLEALWLTGKVENLEIVNYALDGSKLHLIMQLSILPECADNWSVVIIAVSDITARKLAETSLAYISKHDPLTGLGNRARYMEEIDRLEREGPFPVCVIMADLNGLKPVNDLYGHAAGDALLRRAGGILGAAIPKPGFATRIGGDEFAILLPGIDEVRGNGVLQQIQRQAELDNEQHAGMPLSFAMGLAAGLVPGRLDATVRQADLRMYEAKRAYYAAIPERNRRA